MEFRTHFLDILIFVALAVAAWQGWKRGLVFELLSTLGLLAGVAAGFMLHDVVAGLMKPYIGASEWVLKLLAFAITGLLVFRIWIWLATVARDSFRLTSLGMADQGLGAFFGILKASLMISMVFWLSGLLKLQTINSQLSDSALAADVVRLGNSEFTILSKATPLFVRWYGMAKKSAIHLDHQPDEAGTD